ncbi:MAG: DUF502 domain-containing protein [Candidatus Omnitrophica bacterium]|nr:DUF502 domain-containing protein [Candidatus Omnitrophota bacterium]
MIAKIRNSFIAGLLVILPIMGTYFVLKFLVVSLNTILLEPFAVLISPYLGDETLMLLAARAIIFVCVITGITLIGALVRILFVKKILGIFERAFFKLPLIGKVYTAMKQLSSSLFGGNKEFFNAAVLIEYPRKESYAIGFVTGGAPREVDKHIQRDMISIYIPTSPNPTSGIFLLAPKEEIIYLDMTVEEAMKLIISGGAVRPDALTE